MLGNLKSQEKKDMVNNEEQLLKHLILIFRLPKSLKDYKVYIKGSITKEEQFSLQQLFSQKDINGLLTAKCWKKIDFVKNEIFSLIYPIYSSEEEPERFTATLRKKISGLCNDSKLSKIIAQKSIDFTSSVNAQIKAEKRIVKILVKMRLIKNASEVKIINNEVKTANETYILTMLNKNKRYYVKTFSDDKILGNQQPGLINPNELLIYKVLEYMSFGPKTEFLISPGSSSQGYSSIYKGNYIMTEDLASQNNEFILDTELEEEENHPIMKLHKDKYFAIELSAASLINDLLSLGDTFGANPKNYGLVYNKETKKCSIQFVDHLPKINNGLFSVMETFREKLKSYSPRNVLSKKKLETFFTQAAKENKEWVPQEKFLREKVHQRIFVANKSYLSLDKALKKAQKEIMELIEQNELNFIESASKELNNYCQKVEKNINIYRQTEYAQSIDKSLRIQF